MNEMRADVLLAQVTMFTRGMLDSADEGVDTTSDYQRGFTDGAEEASKVILEYLTSVLQGQ